MGKLLRILVSFVVISLLWWAGARYVLPWPEDARATFQLMQSKEQIAAAIARPRVVVLGGSSSRYGYSATQLSEETGLHVLNLGTHAGLGGRYLMDRAKTNLRSGDIAIIALEPVFYVSEYLSVVTGRVVQFATPDYALRAPPRQWPYLLFGVSPHDLLRSWILVSFAGQTPETVGRNGDETGNDPSLVTDYYRDMVRNSPVLPRPLPGDKGLPDYLLDFIAWTKTNGVQLWAAWPVIFDRPEYRSDAYSASFESIAAAYKSQGVPVLGNQLDFALPLDQMFDTGYHANSTGRSVASDALAQAIKDHLARN